VVNAEASALTVGNRTRTEPAPRGPDPFEKLFRSEYPRVVGVANRVLGDRHEAEDVAQEVFIDFHRRHPADAGYAPSWLHAAAVHTALNRLRGMRRRIRREQASALDQDSSALDPQRHLEQEESRRQVRAALRRLPTKPASVLVLRYSGLSYAEVAAALGVRIGQVGTLLRRAEAALRKEVLNAPSE
jgi:RNA polymerase sigma-70 factor (ECF subfamily)